MSDWFKLCLLLGYFRDRDFILLMDVMKCKYKCKSTCLTFAFYFPHAMCARWTNSDNATFPYSLHQAAFAPAVPTAGEKLKSCQALCSGLDNNENWEVGPHPEVQQSQGPVPELGQSLISVQTGGWRDGKQPCTEGLRDACCESQHEPPVCTHSPEATMSWAVWEKV